MKIRRYTVGGITYSPVASSQQVTSQQGVAEKISGTVKKEIIDILKESGIPSDVNAFLTTANSFLGKSTSLSSMSLFGGTNSDYSISDLITIQKMANDVKWNKFRYDEAVKNLDSENAWSEVATDSRGYMYVSDEDGNIKTVNPEKFDPNKQLALTNEEMLALRERSDNFAMNSTLLNNMSSAIGMKTIQEYLVEVVEKLGTSSTQGYALKERDQIINGIEHLMMSGADGYYKVTDKKQARDIKTALHYLYSQLTPQMKRTLEATIAAEGGNVSRDKYNFIGMILTQHIDSEQSVDFDASATKSMGLDAGSLGEVPYLVRIGRGDGEYELVNISMRTDSVMQSGAMMAWATNMGNLVDSSGNTVGLDSLPNIFKKVEAIKATRSKDVTFGGQLLTDVEKNFIVYDGTSQLTDVWLPYKNVKGQITPDFDKLKSFNEWNDWIHKNPNASYIEKMNEARKRGLNPEEMEYNEEKKSWMFKLSKMKLFLSFSAFADDDNVNFTKLTEDLTEPLSNDEGAIYADMFDNLFEYGTTNPKKSDKSTGLDFDTVYRWDLRKGNVFIPIDSDFLSKHMSMKEYAPKSEMNQFAARATITRQMANAQNNVIANLGQFN